jgi:putative ABC transport system permease protein
MLLADIQHGWRSMRARPAASLATICVLALGIGLVSSMFALADPYVTRPLPFTNADRLARLTLVTSVAAEPPTLEAWRARTDLFADLATFGTSESVIVAGPDGDMPLRFLAVSPEYLQVLGAQGPALSDWQARPGSFETPVVLTAAARRRLRDRGSDQATLRALDQQSTPTRAGFRVRGTLPESFLFPESSQSWDGIVPLPAGTPLAATERTPSGLSVVRVRLSVLARLQPSVTLPQVVGTLSTAPVLEAYTLPTSGYLVRAQSVVEAMTGRLWALALGALAAGVLVLLVCAANVANLFIARGAFRQREFATRVALGASGSDLSRLVLVELSLLTVAGIAGGLLIAKGVLAMCALYIPAHYVVLGSPEIAGRTVWFACIAGGVIVIAGLVPAIAAWRVTSLALFNKTSDGEPNGIRIARFAMTAVQTAVAVVLLVGAMLMARSFTNLVTRDPGYDADMFAVGVRYDTVESGRNRREEVNTTVDRLRRLDGVAGAAATVGTLVEGVSGGMAGPALTVGGTRVRGFVKTTGPGFFQVAQARLREGRLLVPGDDDRRAVVGESFARSWSTDRSMVGQHVEWTSRDVSHTVEVVGVVTDILDGALDQTPMPSVYVQMNDASVGYWVTYVLRADRPTPMLIAAIDREIKAVNTKANVAEGGLMQDRLMRSIRDRTFTTLVVTLFALAAIGVSAAGLIGVVAFTVARRTREIAIRIAIGAGRADVRRLVTREVFLSSTVGALAGLIVGAWLSRTMETLLFGIQPADPLAMALAALALVAIVMASAWLPARRALKLSSVQALRAE